MPFENQPAPTASPNIHLTDPVVTDISKSPPSPQNLPQPQPIPATQPPKQTKNLIIVPLIIISLISTAAASLFFNQNKQLNQQITDLTNTINNQQLEPTPSPTTTNTPSPTPNASPSDAKPSTIITKTEPSTSLDNLQALANSGQILSFARQRYPQAELILITIDNPLQNDLSLAKYWFRQTADDKKYLYVSSSLTGLNLVDQQVYVSPDDQIPSLNEKVKNKQLGADLQEILKITQPLCPQQLNCQKISASKAQFLQTPTNLLWQITYQIPGKSQPLIFQIDALTKEVVYQSTNSVNK